MSKQNKSQILGLIAIVLISTVSTIGVVAINDSLNSNSVMANSTASVNNSSGLSSSSSYKDGSYNSNGTFYTPDGIESIGVNLTLSGNKVTSLSIDDSGVYSRTSVEYTRRFIGGINSIVVGRSLDSINVYRVSGASLTTMGFNKAIEIIKNDAKA